MSKVIQIKTSNKVVIMIQILLFKAGTNLDMINRSLFLQIVKDQKRIIGKYVNT